MSRVFLMKWYHFTVEYFEDLRNINHCEFLIMRKQENNKYLLENKLRTWSELRREKKDKEERDREKDSTKLQRTKTFVSTRQWGGCPNGCNHSSHYRPREDLEVLRKQDHEAGGPAPYGEASRPADASSSAMVSRRQVSRMAINNKVDQIIVEQAPEPSEEAGPEIDITANHEGRSVDSLDETPSILSVEDQVQSPYLYIGRDGGGTYSGHTSAANTDTDSSEDENVSLQRVASVNAHRKTIDKNASAVSNNGAPPKAGPEHLTYRSDKHGRNSHPRSNRLGDASPELSGSEGDGELLEDLDHAEDEDRSIRGSVY